MMKKEYNFFHVLLFILPFHGWTYNLGLNLNIFQITLLVTILSLFVQSLYIKKNILNLHNKLILIFLLYLTVDTIIMSLSIDTYLNFGNFFRSEGRFITQIILYIFIFTLIPLAFNYIRKSDDIYKYLKAYLSGIIFLLFLGWLQFFIYHLSGVDIFPIAIEADGTIRTAIYNFQGLEIFRMCSLGGEPKVFSMSLILGFFVIHVANRYKIFFFKHDYKLKYLILFTSFATFSSSGMALFIILLFIDILLFQRFYIKKLSMKKIFGSILFFSILAVIIITYYDVIWTIIELRLLERDVLSEDYDAPIQLFLLDQPIFLFFGSGLGNIHNFAMEYVPNIYKHYMLDNLFVAKSGYLRIISELGLVGFFLFTSIIIVFYLKTKQMQKIVNDNAFVKLSQNLLVLFFIAFLARGYLFNELIILISIINVIIYNNKFKYQISSKKV